MVGFWLLEVSSLLYVIMTLNYFISGHMFPLDLLPPPWPTILKSLPTQYMAYFPAAVFLGKVQGSELVGGLLAEAGWAWPHDPRADAVSDRVEALLGLWGITAISYHPERS